MAEPSTAIEVPAAPATADVVLTEPLWNGITQKKLDEITAGVENEPVRRPVRGIQLKGETFAQISIPGGMYDSSGVGKDGKTTKVTTAKTANFLLQSISMEMEEKFQPIQTFGLTYGFFFGERPHIYTFSAILVDTDNFPWLADWFGNYEEKIRGTRLTMDGSPVTVQVEEHAIKGYIVRCALTKQAETPHFAQLQFSMWVTEHHDGRSPGNVAVPYAPGGTVSETPKVWDKTDAVRRANVENILAARNPGWLRKTLQTISSFKNRYDSAVQTVENFLYNRNIVTPAGALSVADAESAIQNLIGAGPVVFKQFAPVPYKGVGRQFSENRDEYLLTGWIDTRSDFGSVDPGNLVIGYNEDGTPITASPADLIQAGQAAYLDKFNDQFMGRLPLPYQDKLLQNLMQTALSRTATLAAQIVLQGDVVAWASGTVEGTIVAPFGKGFSFGQDVAAPLLGGMSVFVTDALGLRTLTDATIAQVRETQFENSAAGRAKKAELDAMDRAAAAADRNARIRRLQRAAQAATAKSTEDALLDAARSEAAAATEATAAQQAQLSAAERAEQVRQLLADFSSSAGV